MQSRGNSVGIVTGPNSTSPYIVMA